MSEVFNPAVMNMHLQPAAAVQINWETMLDRNILMAKDTARTGNDQFFRNAQILHFSSNIDWSRILRNHLPLLDPGHVSPAVPKPADLHQVNKNFILDVQRRIDSMKPATEAAIKNAQNKDDALAAVDKVFDDYQAQVHEQIEKTRAEVKETIKKFPTEQSRTAAVNVWQESWQAVQKAISTIVNALKSIVNAILNFFSEVWNFVKKAWNTVKDAVKDVVDWIGSLF